METIRNMFKHLHWANQRILETLEHNTEVDKQIINLFSHILLAEQVWFTRLKGLDSASLPIWEEIRIEACAELVKQNHLNYKDYLNGVTENKLEQIVSYRNSKGQEFKNSVGEILTHVGLHGQYHRGQINLLLRKNQIEPINVDFITFKR
ncbi:DinB family protein [Neobacillus niacini]|uniref:DinB family protein n=1 Tax=Neobacillus niacini TaxID=86668 RepID=UPI003002EDAB